MRTASAALLGTSVLLAGLTLGSAGPASAQSDDGLPLETPLMLNVDRDPELETIRVREITCYVEDGESAPPCQGDFPNRDIQIELVNQCNGVEQVTPLLVRTENFVTLAESVELDGVAGREFMVGAASGASGRNGQILVGGVRDTGDGCPKVRRLLTLGPYTPRTVKPKGASYHATGGIVARSLRKDLKGKELIVSQPWFRSGDAGCCPSFVSTAYYGVKNGRYVRYRTRTERISPNG